MTVTHNTSLCSPILVVFLQFIPVDRLDFRRSLGSACLPALSDSTDPGFQACCSHPHNESCTQGCQLQEVLNTLESECSHALCNGEDKEDMLHTIKQAKNNIMTWKSHQLRSVHQDQAKCSILANIKSKSDVFLVQDWAMKFMPCHGNFESRSRIGLLSVGYHGILQLHLVGGKRALWVSNICACLSQLFTRQYRRGIYNAGLPCLTEEGNAGIRKSLLQAR